MYTYLVTKGKFLKQRHSLYVVVPNKENQKHICMEYLKLKDDVPRWYRKSWMYPTVCIHHTAWDTINHTIDWITDVLTHQGQRRWTQKYHTCDFIMQFKYIIINVDGIKPQVLQIWSEFRKSHVEEVELLGQFIFKKNIKYLSPSFFLWK